MRHTQSNNQQFTCTINQKNVNLREEEKWFPANKIFPLTFQKIRIRYSFFPDFPDALNPVICDFKCEMLN